MRSRVIAIVFGSGWAETLCGMLHEARVSISQSVLYGREETGLNYSGDTGCACQKPEMFVHSEALNLPGGQHQDPWWIPGGTCLSASPAYSRMSMRHWSKIGAKRYGGEGVPEDVRSPEWRTEGHGSSLAEKEVVTTRKVHLTKASNDLFGDVPLLLMVASSSISVPFVLSAFLLCPPD